MLISKKSNTRIPLKGRIIYFIPAVVWGIFVLYFSLMPGDDVPELLADMNDKVIHASIYFVGSFLIYLGYIRYKFSNVISVNAVLSIIAISTIVGAVVEIIQHLWVENRNGDWQDFVANTLGSLMSVLLIRLIHGLRA